MEQKLDKIIELLEEIKNKPTVGYQTGYSVPHCICGQMGIGMTRPCCPVHPYGSDGGSGTTG